MSARMIRFVVRKILTVLILLCASMEAIPCTLLSGTDQNHHTWAGNNEDWIFDFDTWINVLPADRSHFGAITFTYDDPQNTVQGELNDQGLFFDYNALPEIFLSAYEDWEKKQDFPGGDEAFVLHIL
jgi:penicillin V acylase-like amidase (Ntn superfamily)